MNKLQFLKHCFDNDGYDNKATLQSIIAIQFEHPDSSGLFKKEPFSVFVENNQFNTLIDGSPHPVEGEINEPLFYMDEILELPGDFHPLLKGNPVRTTFGLFLFNVILIWEPFKGVVDYINKEFTKPLFENLFREIMVDDPKPGEELPPGKASTAQCLEFSHNANYLEGLGTHYIRPGGLDAFTVDPRVIKLRDELFAKHKDELTDPVVFTNIVEQVVALDYEIVMSGPSKKFFIAKKFIDNSRKRMFVAFGIEPSADGKGWTALTRSLDEGWDPEHLADYINTAVAGSYSRSMATGEGGSQVKETLRLLGRAIVSMTITDCGTPVTETIIIEESNKFYWVGAWVLINSKLTKIERSNASEFVGKPIQARVPDNCILIDGEYCKVCCGEGLGAHGERLSSEMALVPTAMMLQRMKAAHTAGSKTSILDIEIALK